MSSSTCEVKVSSSGVLLLHFISRFDHESILARLSLHLPQAAGGLRTHWENLMYRVPVNLEEFPLGWDASHEGALCIFGITITPSIVPTTEEKHNV